MPRFRAPILVGACALVAFAHQTRQPAPRLSVQTKLVRISATVRDKHGEIVPTLNKDDFVLRDDGYLQTITNFVKQSDLPLALGLLVQTSLGPRQLPALHKVSAASYGFLDHMLRESDDKAFVIRFDHEVELLQGFTSSRPKLDAALELTQTTESGGVGPHGERLGGTLLYDAVCLGSNELMKAPQGRKALFVLSDGIDRGSKHTLEDSIQAAQRTDTSVYSILVAENWPGPNGKKVLERISTETGGRMFKISNGRTVVQIFAQAEEELRNEYVLGYSPAPANTGTYHKVHLTTRRKDLRVQAQDGYPSDRSSLRS